MNGKRGREKYTQGEGEESRPQEMKVRRMGRKVTCIGEAKIASRNKEAQHEDEHYFSNREGPKENKFLTI